MRTATGHVPFGLGFALAAALLSGCQSTNPDQASNRPPLYIGVNAHSPPLIFQQKGRWLGVEAELGRALTDRLGMRPVWVAFPPSKLTDALLDGKVDLLLTLDISLQINQPHADVGEGGCAKRPDLRNSQSTRSNSADEKGFPHGVPPR